jgi:hypothetical protein
MESLCPGQYTTSLLCVFFLLRTHDRQSSTAQAVDSRTIVAVFLGDASITGVPTWQKPVPFSGKGTDADDLRSVFDASLDCWFTTGRFAEDFERTLARFVGIRSASLVNSGSPANPVALSALTSPKLGERSLQSGDELITVAAGFPATVNAIFRNRLVLVFLDVTIPTYEIDSQHWPTFRSLKDQKEYRYSIRRRLRYQMSDVTARPYPA